MPESHSSMVVEQSRGICTFDSYHTPESPYCRDLSCDCHFSVAYHLLVIAVVPITCAEEMVSEVFSLFLARPGRKKKEYAPNFKRRSRECKEAAGYICQKCGIVAGTELLSWSGNMWRVYMVAAHVNHDKGNPEAELMCVCPRCHWRHYRKSDHKAVWIVARMKHRRLLAARGYSVKGAF